MIIGIDIDLTIVDTGSEWLHWLNKATGRSLTLEDLDYDYDLGVGFRDALPPSLHKHFWKQHDLYDNLEPYDDALEVITKMCDDKDDVVFISHCFDEHYLSKRNFIRKWFPRSVDMINTEHKWLVGECDVFIDDRHEFLNQFWNTDTRCIKYNTPYKQNKPLYDTEIEVINNWKELKL